ncbi:unnamed protein product [Gongylonema pulchrum]|uniref:WWE domain-containing protein n=1 Tax=Gongylonema pulchrum TaxID=637853 RepID=A0A183D975_9BILA|nr:unnamed protein product [Gongylonema pulchrum]
MQKNGDKASDFPEAPQTDTATGAAVAVSVISEITVSDVTGSSSSSSPPVELSREAAAPIYAKPRGSGKAVYKTDFDEDGRRVANYVLFEDSMAKAKVPWQAYSGMTAEERDIYMAHLKAVRERRLTYKDPKTGYTVMTVSQLLLNGKCCGSGCRHCPYQHENAAPEIRKSKIWNGAFYV